MAGVLLYTSAPDAEGTLGGLVNLGKPGRLWSDHYSCAGAIRPVQLGPVVRRPRTGCCDGRAARPATHACWWRRPAANAGTDPRPVSAGGHVQAHRAGVVFRLSELANALPATVGSLSSAHVGAPAASYQSCGSFSAGFAAKVEKTVPAPHQDEVQLLNAAVTQPELTGAGLAIALESAQAARRAAHLPAVEVVVTGPDSPAAAVAHVRGRRSAHRRRQATGDLGQLHCLKVPTVVGHGCCRCPRAGSTSFLSPAENLDGGGGAGAYTKFPTYHWPLECRNPPRTPS